MAYMRSVGLLLSVAIMFLYTINNAAGVYANFWLSEWSNDADMNMTAAEMSSQRTLRLGVYGALGLAQGKTNSIFSLASMHRSTSCSLNFSYRSFS